MNEEKKKAEDNFLMLSFIASQEDTQSIITEKIAKAFEMLRNMSNWKVK